MDFVDLSFIEETVPALKSAAEPWLENELVVFRPRRLRRCRGVALLRLRERSRARI